MSLLMEALRKAEAAKKKAQQEGSKDAAESASSAAPVDPIPESSVPEPESPALTPEPVSLDDEWVDPELPQLTDDELKFETSPLDFDLDFLADEEYSDSTGNAELEINIDLPDGEAASATSDTQTDLQEDKDEDEIDFGDPTPAVNVSEIELDLQDSEPVALNKDDATGDPDIRQQEGQPDPTDSEQHVAPAVDEEFSLDGEPVIVADRLAVSGAAPIQEDEQTIDFETPPEPLTENIEESVDNDSYSTFEFDGEGLDSLLDEGEQQGDDDDSLETVTFNETSPQDSHADFSGQEEDEPPAAARTGLTTRDLIDESEPAFSMDAAGSDIFGDEDATPEAEDLSATASEPPREEAEEEGQEEVEEEEVDEFEKATRALLQREEDNAKERSEFEKQHASKLSARSIFAAKQGAGSGSKRRLLVGGSSIAALLLIGAASYYYFLILPGSGGMGFSGDLSSVSSIPSQDNGQEPVNLGEPIAVEEGVEATVATLNDVGEELPSEGAFTVVISEDTTTVSEVLPDENLAEAPTETSTQPGVPIAEVSEEGLALTQELASEALLNENPGPVEAVPAESASAELAMSEDAQPTRQLAESEADSTDTTPGIDPGSAVEPQTPTQVAQVPAPEPPGSSGLENEVAQTTAETASASSPDAAAMATAEAPISFNPTTANSINFRKTAPDEDVNPLIDRAYSAYQRGVTSLAKQLYQEVLDESPYHRDALLGLAAIAAANRETLIALQYYDRILARYPNDPIARAARLEFAPPGTDVSQERELKELAAANPDAPSLPYALGNLFASQQKWSQAQQAYFDALSLAKARASRGGGPVNPDYAFNLAVSLEHLRQATSAEIYYREALEFANRHFASFDVPRLRARLESNNRAAQ